MHRPTRQFRPKCLQVYSHYFLSSVINSVAGIARTHITTRATAKKEDFIKLYCTQLYVCVQVCIYFLQVAS